MSLYTAAAINDNKMASTTTNDDITRVMLWCTPRTVSTSFLKCLTSVPNSQAWYEPYLMSLTFSNCYRFRDEIVGMLRSLWAGEVETAASFGATISGGYWTTDKSHSWIKNQLESLPPDNKKVVFVKDTSWGIDGLYQYIPDGFRHSFLIRHPNKVFASWKRAVNRGITDESKHMKLTEMPETMMTKGFFFTEQYNLYQHVKEKYEENPVVIDIDDLLSDPGRVLKAYCQAVGIPYTDDLLQWKPGRECQDGEWMVAKEQILVHNLTHVHDETFASTGFGQPSNLPPRDNLSDDVLYCSDLCMKYYEDMYANRLQV